MALFHVGGLASPSTKRNVLMVAEYSNIGMAIAEKFPNKASPIEMRQVGTPDRRNGPFWVFEFDANWPGTTSTHFKMVSTSGQLADWNFKDEKFQDRLNSGGNGELFNAKIELVPKSQGRMARFLFNEAEDCDLLILWLNCDKMGDSICLDVMEAIGWKQNDDHVYRARYFAITELEIQRALCNLGKIDTNSAMSLNAMHVVDLRIGCAFTRFLTQRCRETGEIAANVPFGPVMTPTLAFIVQRDQECKTTAPKLRWELVGTLKRLGPHGFVESKFKLFAQDITDEQTAEEMVKHLEEYIGKTVAISVTSEVKYVRKPIGLSSLELMRQASTRFQMLPEKSVRLAEDLYLRGKITYPRTESTAYPRHYFESDHIVRALENLRKDPKWQVQINRIMRFDFSSPPQGSTNYETAPPIMPLDSFPSEFIETNEGIKPVFGPNTKFEYECEQIHQLIVENFLASLAENCHYMSNVARFKIGNFEFSAKENVVDAEGFTAFVSEKPINEAKYGFEQNQELTIVGMTLECHEEAPSLMTVAELLSEMEGYHLGGQRSTASLIGNMINRGFIIVDPETQQITPTPRGTKLIELFQKHGPSLLKPILRCQMEIDMRAIRNDHAYNAAVNKWINTYKTEFDLFRLKWLKK